MVAVVFSVSLGLILMGARLNRVQINYKHLDRARLKKRRRGAGRTIQQLYGGVYHCPAIVCKH